MKAQFLRSAAAIAEIEREQSQPMVGHQGTRFAGFNPNSYSADTHTVEAILSAGSPVLRPQFTEELEISNEAVDLARAKAGLVTLLDCHNQWQTDAVLGTVSNVRIVGNNLVGLLTFGKTEKARQVEGMVARGELRGVSVGYRVTAWKLMASNDGRDTWRATQWELLEVSLVPVPADAHAGVRSQGGSLPGSSDEDEEMLHRSNPAGDDAPASPPAVVPPGNVTRFDAVQALDFVNLAREFGVETTARNLVQQNARGEIGVEVARDAIMRAAAEKQRADTSFVGAGGTALVGGPGSMTYDNPAFIARAIEDALYSRLSGAQPSEPARELRGMTMVQLAGELLMRSGIRNVHRMTSDQILDAAWNSRSGPAHSTSDFPDLLTASGNRYLLDQFAVAASVIKVVSRERSAADFREISGLQLSAFGTLPEVIEDGEVKAGTFQSRKEVFRIKTYAKTFSLTRQAIINDDLNAFGSSMVVMARAAAETEATILAELINSNPQMADNVALFHATHGNLAGSGAAPDVTTLAAGRLAMRSQKDLDGVTPLACAPKFILVSPTRETAIEQLLVATTVPTSSDDANPFTGKLTPLVEPRIDANPWYLFGDPGQVPVLEHAYLNGHTGPQVSMREGWNVLGQEFRVVMDFGAGIVDHRGAYKNPGA